MIYYFKKSYRLKNFEQIREQSYEYLRERLKKQHEFAFSKLENLHIYKPEIQTFSEVAYYKRRSYKYKYIHSLGVAEKCRLMAIREDVVAPDMMELCGVFHDISHYLCKYEMHGKVSGEMAKVFLRKFDCFTPEDLNQVSKIIEAHCPVGWSDAYFLSDRISMEEMILIECDHLDKLDIASFYKKVPDITWKELTLECEKCNAFATSILNEPILERDCVYTKSFLDFVEEQIEANNKFMRKLKAKGE